MGNYRKIVSPDVMDAVVELYASECFSARKRMTMSGLLLALGLSCRRDLEGYAKLSDEWSEAVSRAFLTIEESYEMALVGTGSSGAQFALVNIGRGQWQNKSEVDHRSGDGSMTPTRITRRIVDPEAPTNV